MNMWNLLALTFTVASAAMLAGCKGAPEPLLEPDRQLVDELARKKREFLAEIDAHAKRVEESVAPVDGFDVHACAFRDAARNVTKDGDFDYISSTYSFEHDTRDDVRATNNDWDVYFDWRDPRGGYVSSLMVTDDRGSIVNLGVRDPNQFDPSWIATGDRVAHMSPLAQDVLFVVETIDNDTERYDLMQVLEVRPAHDVVFRWREISDDDEIDAVRSALKSNPRHERGDVPAPK